MTAIMAWQDVLQANIPYFLAVGGLMALDLLVGLTRALASRKFQSALLRSTLLKSVEEIALPMMLAFLGLANHVFYGFVTAALWVGIVAEATSLVEQLRGRTAGGLWGEVLKLLHDLQSQVSNTLPPDGTGGAT
jgi:small basic protein